MTPDTLTGGLQVVHQSRLDDWAETLQRQGKSQGTIDQRLGHIRRMIEAGVDPEKATSEALADYLLSHDAWAPEYRRKIADSLRSFFTWAHATGILSMNPTDQLPQIRRPSYRPHPAPDSVLLDGFENGSLAERAIISLAATEMLRRTEIANLHPSNRTSHEITFIGKGQRERTVPLSSTTYELLCEIEKEQGVEAYYFPGRFGGHLHPSTVYKWVKKWVGDDWDLHSLRHRGATNGYRQTRNLRGLQILLGHAQISTTQIYTDVSNAELREIIESNALPRALNSRHITNKNSTTWSKNIYFLDLDHVTPDDVRTILDAAQRSLSHPRSSITHNSD